MHHHKQFNDKSDIYANSRPRYPQALYTFLASQCNNHDTVWDAACGNGQAAIDLAAHFQTIEASDVSDGQISHAIQHPKVNYSVQASESTTFADNSFDLVCVAQALHWFDYDLFWPEVERILKPNGIFAAWGYSWPLVNREIDAILQETLLNAIAPYWAVQNRILWNNYVDVAFPFTPIDAPAFEMNVNWTLDQFFSYLHSWSAVRRCMEAMGDSFFQDAYAKTAEVWETAVIKKINMDFCLIAGKNKAK